MLQAMMISAKRLVAMARKWQKVAAGKRKRISYPNTPSSPPNKGHFVVYSSDHKRFVVPLKYLSNSVFRELLKWAEEEFGPASGGPLVLPFDGVFLEYVISLLQQSVPEDLQKALIASMATCHGFASASSSVNALTQYSHQQPVISGY